MLRLCLIGSAELVGGGGGELRQVLAQPKRLGLLVYLALAQPAGFHRRDTLLALFWPELDTESARRALRQSLHFLRTHLGPDVIEARGMDELRLTPGALWCDVLALRDAVANGRLTEAIELGRGELLPGFHVKDASSDFDLWLSEQRAKLRQTVALTALALASAEEGEGRPARALVAARRALDLAPTDEGTARTVMRLSHALGDGEGALETYAALDRRLREYDAVPERDTRALAEAIRRELGSRTAAGRPSIPIAVRVSPAASAPSTPSQDEGSGIDLGQRSAAVDAAVDPERDAASDVAGDTRTRAEGARVHGRRRALAWPALSFIGLCAGAIALLLLGAFNVGPAATLFAGDAPKRRDLLVLTDFAAPGGDASLARVVSHVVRDALTQSTALDVMPPSRVASTLELMDRARDARVDLATAREVAQREGGTAVVDGEVAQVGSGYVVTVRLLAADTERVLATFQRAGDGPQGLMEVADELARALRRQTGESLRDVQASVPLRRARTASLEAARLFTEGAHANEVLVNWPLAAEKFRGAGAIDSNFAMAWLYLGAVYANMAAPRSQVDSATTRAYQLRDRLPPMERTAVEGAYFGMGPGRDRAKALASAKATPNAWSNVALQFQRRREFARAESTWRAGLARDSSVLLPMRNLALNLRLQGKLDAADSLDREIERRFGIDPAVQFNRALGPWLRGDVAGAERAIDSLARRPGAGGPILVVRASLALMRGQRDLWRSLVARGRAADSARGRAVPSVVDVANSAALEWRAFGRAPDALAEVDRLLARFPLSALPEVDRPYIPVATALAWAGQPARARALLREYASAVRDTALRRSQLADLRTAEGAIAFAERRYREAIALFRQGDSLPDGPANLYSARLPLSLGLTFDAANEPDSAIAQYERYLAIPVMGRVEPPFDPASLAQIHERLGQLYEERRDLDRALAHHLAFVQLWERADPDLQPRVAMARQRVERLMQVLASQRRREPTRGEAEELPVLPRR